GVLGTHVPVVADSEDFVLRSPGPIAAGLILIYGGLLILAARRAVAHPPAALLLATAALGLIAFALPVRSAPHTIRFLTPIYLPVAALAAWAFVAAGRPRRSLVAVLALAGLHLAAGSKLLETWRAADRTEPPFLLVDL